MYLIVTIVRIIMMDLTMIMMGMAMIMMGIAMIMTGIVMILIRRASAPESEWEELHHLARRRLQVLIATLRKFVVQLHLPSVFGKSG